MYQSFDEYVESVCRLERCADVIEAVLKKVGQERIPELHAVLTKRMDDLGITWEARTTTTAESESPSSAEWNQHFETEAELIQSNPTALERLRKQRDQYQHEELQRGRKAGKLWAEADNTHYSEVERVSYIQSDGTLTAYEVANELGGDADKIFGDDSEKLSIHFIEGWLSEVAEVFSRI